MTEIRDPGTPDNDEIARNVALHAIAEQLDANPYRDGDYEGAVGTAADVLRKMTVTWERDVNSAGVPVRRYVLRGAWEVDPERATTQQGNGTLMVENDLEQDEARPLAVVQVADLGAFGATNVAALHVGETRRVVLTSAEQTPNGVSIRTVPVDITVVDIR